MKKLKIAILILIIIIFCILGVMLIMYMLKNTERNISDNNSNSIQIEGVAPTLITDTSYNLLKTNNTFFSIEKNIKTYLRYVSQQNNKSIYSILDQEYINKKGIDESNVLNNINIIPKFEDFWLEKVYSKVIESNVETQYYIKGTILTKDYESKQYVFFILSLDLENNTYSITPCQEYNLETTSFETIMENLIQRDNRGIVVASETKGKGTHIEKNEYNTFSFINLDDEMIIKMYMERYKTNAIYYIEDAYGYLDKDCRNKKFANISEYEKYIKETKERLEPIQYRIESYNDYEEYTVMNKHEEKIIFIVTSPMQFTIKVEE